MATIEEINEKIDSKCYADEIKYDICVKDRTGVTTWINKVTQRTIDKLMNNENGICGLTIEKKFESDIYEKGKTSDYK